jgi:hypothetical protein
VLSLLDGSAAISITLDGVLVGLYLRDNVLPHDDVGEANCHIDFIDELFQLTKDPRKDIALEDVDLKVVKEVADMLEVGVRPGCQDVHVDLGDVAGDDLAVGGDLILLSLTLEGLSALEILQLPLIHVLHALRVGDFGLIQVGEVVVLRLHNSKMLFLKDLHSREPKGLPADD